MDKRFLRVFSISLVAIALVSMITAVFQQLDAFLEHRATFFEIVKAIILVSIGIFPYILISALSIAVFDTFRRVERANFTKVFYRYIVIALVIVPLLWSFDNYLQPMTLAKSVQTQWNMINKVGGGYTEAPLSQFINITASTSSKGVIKHCIDSLTVELSRIVQSKESDDYSAQRQEHDISSKISAYRYENVKRNVNSLMLIFAVLIFACLGYASRNHSIKKMLGYLAIIIVCIYAMTYTVNAVKKYSEYTSRMHNEIKDKR